MTVWDNAVALQCLVCPTVNPPDEQHCLGCGNPLLDWDHISGKYSAQFTASAFQAKLDSIAGTLDRTIILQALTLYYASEEAENLPTWAGPVIGAALGLFIAEDDIIPDDMPTIGFADDSAVMGIALALLESHISLECRNRAKEKVKDMFP